MNSKKGVRLPEYYFDIETYSHGLKPNPVDDKIITIQFQNIDLRSGKPKGDLIILKEWESSEADIIKEFHNRFFLNKSNIFSFVPVGFNLNFEWEVLIQKFEKYLKLKLTSKDLHYTIPHVDLKPIVVILNNGNFVGAKLNNFTKKSSSGEIIKSLYESKNFYEIEKYIREENDAFLEFLQKIIRNKNKLLE